MYTTQILMGETTLFCDIMKFKCELYLYSLYGRTLLNEFILVLCMCPHSTGSSR